MKKGLLLAIAIGVVLLSSVFFLIYKNSFSADSDFTTDSLLVKSVMKQNEILNRTIIIESKNENDFSLEITDLENVVSLDEQNFHLNSGEMKEIQISFSAESNPGVYFGSLIVQSEKSKQEIPVIVEIQSLNQDFAVSTDVDSSYRDIRKNSRFSAGVNFFSLKDTETKSVDVEYLIISKDGEKIFSEEENIAVGSKTTITKTIEIQNLEKGDYVFAAILNFQNSTSTASYLFTVSSRITLEEIINEDYFIAAILVILFIIVGIIIYILVERDRLISKLNEQQKSQLKFYSSGIEKQRVDSLKKAKNEKEKEKINRDYSEARSKVLNEIKREQKSQRTEIRKISGKKRDSEVARRIRKWKKQTYAKALQRAQIKQEMKSKLATLKRAYSEGYISKDSYKKVSGRLSRKINK